MSNITIKVAGPGEGKTKWLLEQAHTYSVTNDVLFVATDENEYYRFCEKYFATYNQICPVQRFHVDVLKPTSVVLVDELLQKHGVDVLAIQHNCSKVLVTIEGDLA